MTFTLHGRIPSKKNSKRLVMAGHRPVILSSKDYEAWHTIACYELKSQFSFQGFSVQLKGPLAVSIKIFSDTKRIADLSNKAESLMDLLVDMGVLKDDNWFEVPMINLEFGGVDKSNPRAEVEIKSAIL